MSPKPLSKSLYAVWTTLVALTLAGCMEATSGGLVLTRSGATSQDESEASDDVSRTLQANVTSAIADGQSMITVRMTLRSSTGAPLLNRRVAVDTDRGGADTFTPSETQTGLDGEAVFTLVSTDVGDANIQAYLPDISQDPVEVLAVTFVAGPPDEVASSVDASSATSAVGTHQTVTVTLRDALGHALGDRPVTLTSSNAGSDTITPLSTLTDPVTGAIAFDVVSSGSGCSTYSAVAAATGTAITSVAMIAYGAATCP